jgi:hypothetical protein
MEYIHWRQLVGVAYTEEEAKALAAECEVRREVFLPEGWGVLDKLTVDCKAGWCSKAVARSVLVDWCTASYAPSCSNAALV